MANKKLPIYELIINPSDNDSGVDAVALVDHPAIEDRGVWMMFDKQTDYSFKATDTEKRIISGFLMVADMPIYRRDDARGEYYVVFKKNTIEQIVKKFAKNNYFNNVNAMHDPEAKIGGVFMIESFMVDSSRGLNTPKGFDKAPNGSWYGSYYVENDMVWNDFIKTGVFKGFSVEGMFGYDYKENVGKSSASDYCKVVDEVIALYKK